MIDEICWTKYEPNPNTDKSKQIPNKSGIYIICAKNIDKLPKKMAKLTYSFWDEFPIVYVGTTSKLRGRYQNHFIGNARGSTLRKSFGVLFDYRKEQSTKDFGTNKYKFVYEDEKKIKEWMTENLIFYYITTDVDIESELIDKYDPPLNIDTEIMDNKQSPNFGFRKKLEELRPYNNIKNQILQ